MYTQNTPVHVRLWHHDFWRLAMANLFLSMAVYMQIPMLPLWLEGCSKMDVAIAMGIFGIGIFCLGPFCSYLVQHYRRSHVYVTSVFVMVACLAVLLYQMSNNDIQMERVWLSRVVMGGAYGLAQMILLSTLVIDTTESFQRTEANHSAAWFGRFGLSLGPILALAIYPFFGFSGTMICAMACSLIAVILVLLVHFSFKAPEEKLLMVNLDRFYLPHGSILFLNLFLTTIAVGIILSLPQTLTFYAMMMAGFLLALIC
ncbi:MAG: MFS transporter, partial [Prevotella sp.]|nr:MFS transporter [Prevotella sp.]